MWCVGCVDGGWSRALTRRHLARLQRPLSVLWLKSLRAVKEKRGNVNTMNASFWEWQLWGWVHHCAGERPTSYNINYKTTDIDVSESPDGAYELHFQQIGEPDWPFGSTHARLVLESNGKTVTTCSFDIANDGKNLSPENWETTWGSDHASATIFGEEQSDYRYNLSLDGEIEELQLDTYNGKTIPDAQNEAPKIDEDGYPTAQDYQAYKREMAAVASYIGVDGFEMEYKITAKGYPYAVISREPNEKTGQVTELHIILNEQHERLSNREYVLQKHRFAADGAESAFC